MCIFVKHIQSTKPTYHPNKKQRPKIPPASDNLHIWGKGRLRKRSANHASLDKFDVAKCCTTFATFPCQCSSVPFEAALLSQSWAVLKQRLSFVSGYVRGCQGPEKHARAENCSTGSTGSCLLKICIIALWLRKLISTHDLDKVCLLVFENKWLKPGNIIACYRGLFSLLSATTQRNCLDPQNFWLSGRRKHVWLLVLSSLFHQYEDEILIWWGWAALSNSHTPKAPE